MSLASECGLEGSISFYLLANVISVMRGEKGILFKLSVQLVGKVKTKKKNSVETTPDFLSVSQLCKLNFCWSALPFIKAFI